MSPTAWIVLLVIAFTVTHLGLASVRVEPRLRSALGDAGFLGMYSAVALLLFVPLVWVYFANRHAGEWLWAVPVGPLLRAVLYLAMGLGVVLVVASLVRPSPASLAPGADASATGAYRVTRHPLVMGLGLVFALHLVPNGSSADVAFFGGLATFSVLGAWHQDRRKLHADAPGFRAFHAATPFWPFTGRGALRGLAEIPAVAWLGGVAAAVGIRWLHGSLWPGVL
jgi:uncharacterized membrane protein